MKRQIFISTLLLSLLIGTVFPSNAAIIKVFEKINLHLNLSNAPNDFDDPSDCKNNKEEKSDTSEEEVKLYEDYIIPYSELISFYNSITDHFAHLYCDIPDHHIENYSPPPEN